MKRYTACLIGCGRMGATIDDEVRDRPDSFRWLPYSHAAALAAIDRIEFAGVSDVVPEKVEMARQRYGVPRGYTDYRAMLEAERPDLVCIATRPGPHAEQVCVAAERGVRAIYCEKPLCCSMAEADAMVDVCERHGVLFNYGTQRRYIPVYRKLRAMIEEGAVGKPHAVIAHYGVSAALWGHTHTVDLIQFMAGDAEVEFVQGCANARDDQWDGDRLTVDPGIPMGYARFKNGIHGYTVAGTGNEVEVSGSDGNLRTLNDAIGVQWRRANQPWRLLEERPFPEVPWQSGTVNGIRELIDALDGGPAPTGGIRVARQSFEMVMGFVASHRKGGVRVPLPLVEREMAIRPEGW